MKLFNSKKFVAGAAIFLGAAAITSSALAAYIVTGGNKSTSVDATQTPVEVTNNIVNVTAAFKGGSNLIFQPTNPVNEGRLTSTGKGIMSLDLDVTVEAAVVDNINDITLTIEAKTAANGENLAIGKYIVIPTNLTVSATDIKAATPQENKYTVTHTLEWTWGTEFGNTDPCTYFNKSGAGEKEEDSVLVSKMNGLKEATADLKYVIGLTMA